jgi:beta-N-acetylhexosaminidase
MHRDTSLEIKLGQLIMAGIPGTAAGEDAEHLIRDLQVGNVILMGRNVASPAQILSLTRDLQALALAANGFPLLIATDQEGGQVQRLNSGARFMPMPDAASVGACPDPAAIRRYARAAGEEMRAVGIDVDFAPVLDVDDNALNPTIGRRGRSFGATPHQVEHAAVPFIQGLRDAGVLATGKHFPGHGNTSKDSHVALPTVAKDRASLASVEIPPFQRAIDEGIELILTAHVTYPALDPSGAPATISAPILTGLLRRAMGFQGLIVTDDLEMDGIKKIASPAEAAVRAVEAGADLVLCVRQHPSRRRSDPIESLHTALLDAARTGRLSPARIDESFNRIVDLKTRHALGPASGDGLDLIGGPAHLQTVADLHVVERQPPSGGRLRGLFRALSHRARSRLAPLG